MVIKYFINNIYHPQLKQWIDIDKSFFPFKIKVTTHIKHIQVT